MIKEDIFSTDVEKVLPALKSELESLRTIWLPRERKGDGEAGRLLEQALGVPENNRKDSDIPVGDLKTREKDSNGKLSLFSRDKDTYLMPIKEIYDRFGFVGRKHPLSLQSSVTQTPNRQDFYYYCNAEGVYLACRKVNIQFWSWQTLTDCFKAKFPGLITVHYAKKKINNLDHFQFTDAFYFPHLEAAVESFLTQLREDNVIIEVRRYWSFEKGKEGKNRGTDFRVTPEAFNQIFQTRQRII